MRTLNDFQDSNYLNKTIYRVFNNLWIDIREEIK